MPRSARIRSTGGAPLLPRRASITGLRFHDLRHGACSRLIERGLSPLEVASIGGYRTMQMLKRCSHFSVEHLLGKIERGSWPVLWSPSWTRPRSLRSPCPARPMTHRLIRVGASTPVTSIPSSPNLKQ